jgi:hypothetical protein
MGPSVGRGDRPCSQRLIGRGLSLQIPGGIDDQHVSVVMHSPLVDDGAQADDGAHCQGMANWVLGRDSQPRR